jgi:hypothetical protein
MTGTRDELLARRVKRAPSKAVVERRIIREADALIESMGLYLDTWGEGPDRWFEALISELGAVCRNLEAPEAE